MDRSAYFLVVPLLAILAFVEMYPLAVSVDLSFTDYSRGGAFVGAANYATLFSQSSFWNALSTSVLYSGGSAALSTVIGILFAYLLTRAKRGKGFFEAVLLMPLAAAPIIAGVVWNLRSEVAKLSAGPAIRHMGHVDASHHLEQFTRHMRGVPVPADAMLSLPGLALA